MGAREHASSLVVSLSSVKVARHKAEISACGKLAGGGEASTAESQQRPSGAKARNLLLTSGALVKEAAEKRLLRREKRPPGLKPERF